eukprot:scaffold478_cov409-Prasinococcus_capsulatus_cf.AAC.9
MGSKNEPTNTLWQSSGAFTWEGSRRKWRSCNLFSGWGWGGLGKDNRLSSGAIKARRSCVNRIEVDIRQQLV